MRCSERQNAICLSSNTPKAMTRRPHADVRTDLPIETVLPEVQEAMATAGIAVLAAPPGAGKTTRVPLALLSAPWLQERRILLLEPRRIAARAAAARMANALGEEVGDTVGIRARLQTKVSRATRVEVLTEGVFTRMIIDDPELTGIGAILFDEFHERSLDADFGLALALDCRSGLRDDLRLLVMSATLETSRVASLLDNAPCIESDGRIYPVETRYAGRDPTARLEDDMSAAILRALGHEKGSILAFLPGAGEIRRTQERLSERIAQRDDAASIILAPLYGALDPREQDRAIAPPPAGHRKVVLATAIAETSLTIEGVRIVIDSGLSRVPRFEPAAGVTRLETIRASRASVEQRRGRAGRTAPGICIRLWDEPQTQSLPEAAEPEIAAADLSGLLLDTAEWGVTDPAMLSWMDQPPKASLDAARDTLRDLSAIDDKGNLTERGRHIRRLPLPPRLAAMVLDAAGSQNGAQEAAEIAALLVERGLGGKDPDLTDRMRRFRRDTAPRARNMRRLAESWAASASSLKKQSKTRTQTPPLSAAASHKSIACHLAHAFPERIAMNRGRGGRFLLASGRGAQIDEASVLARAQYLVVADMQGSAASTRILTAAELSEKELHWVASARLKDHDELTYETGSASVRARRKVRLGAIAVSSEPVPLDTVAPEAVTATLCDGISKAGLEALPWSKPQSQLRKRIGFLRKAGDTSLPDLSDKALRTTMREWLGPFINGKSRLSDITASDLSQALDALLTWPDRQRLDEKAPSHFDAPTGERHPIDYDGEGAPGLAIRVQELFGTKHHPAIADGRLPLTLTLLSPAHRPIQVTRDLPGFWAGSWTDVKAEMKGRYPKHVWPDDPANAEPTRRAKPRGR